MRSCRGNRHLHGRWLVCTGNGGRKGNRVPVSMDALGSVGPIGHLKCGIIGPATLVLLSVVVHLLFAAVQPTFARDEKIDRSRFTLASSIEQALKRNPDMLISREGISAARLNKQGRFTEFLPKLSGSYGYVRLDEERESLPGVIITPQDLYTFTATVDQPLFTGFSTINEFDIAKLDLQIAEIQAQEVRQELVYRVKEAYYNILQEQNLTMVAEQAVEQLASQVEQATDFYEVGLIPKNDLLESEVELANARLDRVVAQNRVTFAESRFNILLQRPLDAPVSIERIEKAGPFDKSYQTCVELALEQRPEKELAMLAVQRSQEAVELAKGDYYPAVNLQANYLKTGDSADVDGGTGIYDDEEWNFSVTASWTFWEWGRSVYDVREKLRRHAQAQLELKNVKDRIRREVKDAYLSLREAERNIVTQEKAVEQAKENFRITKERFNEQVATSTEVIEAQTLLTRTQNNYYNALNGYNLSKAALYRAMGAEVE